MESHLIQNKNLVNDSAQNLDTQDFILDNKQYQLHILTDNQISEVKNHFQQI